MDVKQLTIDEAMNFRASLPALSVDELTVLAVEMTGTVLGDFVVDELLCRLTSEQLLLALCSAGVR